MFSNDSRVESWITGDCIYGTLSYYDISRSLAQDDGLQLEGVGKVRRLGVMMIKLETGLHSEGLVRWERTLWCNVQIARSGSLQHRILYLKMRRADVDVDMWSRRGAASEGGGRYQK